MNRYLMIVVYLDKVKIQIEVKIKYRNDHALTLKALPSVSLHLPPDGLARMFLQLLQAITD